MLSQKALQRTVNARLKLWLDLAALPSDFNLGHVRPPGLAGLLAPLLPSPQQAGLQLMEHFFQEGRAIADEIGVFPDGVRDEKFPEDDRDPFSIHAAASRGPIYGPHAAQIFYTLLINTRSVLETILAVTDLLRKTGGNADHGQFRAGLPSFDFSQRITINKGRAIIEDDPTWQKFKAALNGVDVDRLRRCPEPKCQRIYYATRQNKKACDKHLALAAVKRSQMKKKAKAAEYELNRKASRLAKKNKGIGIGQALKLVRAQLKSNS